MTTLNFASNHIIRECHESVTAVFVKIHHGSTHGGQGRSPVVNLRMSCRFESTSRSVIFNIKYLQKKELDTPYEQCINLLSKNVSSDLEPVLLLWPSAR